MPLAQRMHPLRHRQRVRVVRILAHDLHRAEGQRLTFARLPRRQVEALLHQQHVAVPREHRAVEAAVRSSRLLQCAPPERAGLE
ncbi:hypothetical protein WJ99_25470 [Burkholderia ubonensis]|nr:hypothetical protein WJ99_25470 [Burkholderia ubonensis]